jgi:hypothetical protein
VGSQKSHDVDGDEGDRNDWPAAALHIFVAQRNQHGVTLSWLEAAGMLSSV